MKTKLLTLIFLSFSFMSIGWGQDTTYIRLPNAVVGQPYFNDEIVVNLWCNGCPCPTGEYWYDTQIISSPAWLDSIYIDDIYSYDLVLGGTPSAEDIETHIIELHEFLSPDMTSGYWENPTWYFTDVYIISLTVINPNPEIGDDCITEEGEIGFIDCYENCLSEIPYISWIGDGYCDNADGFSYWNFDCPELGYDCGDCNEDWDGSDPLGFCSECAIYGDINNDDQVNILDIVIIVDCILSSNCDECSDLNSDGETNILDIVVLVNMILVG